MKWIKEGKLLKELKKVFTIFVNYVILKKPHNYIILFG